MTAAEVRTPDRRTKIVCTLGPSSFDPDVIEAMIRAGMNVARLNSGHGNIDSLADTIRTVRDVAKRLKQPVATLIDLAGPKIRTRELLNDEPIALRQGTEVAVSSNTAVSEAGSVGVDYQGLEEHVHPGHRILLDDGKIELLVESGTETELQCRVVTSGLLGGRKGVTLPQSEVMLNVLTARDRQAISVGVKAGVDFFALSFVADASDVQAARLAINSAGGDTPIIAKIERRLAVNHLDEIVAAADGAMVARGDLGVELLPEDVPLQQRLIIETASRRLVPVITATQMLESMIHSLRPTRAETSDIANTVWDYSDALMLSGETASGDHPVAAVEMMDRIIRAAETALPSVLTRPPERMGGDRSLLVALAAKRIAEADPETAAVVCYTGSGYTAFLLSKIHPGVPIIALTPEEAIYRRLALARGVTPLVCARTDSTDEMLVAGDAALQAAGLLPKGAKVVVVGSLPVQMTGTTNFLKLHTIGGDI